MKNGTTFLNDRHGSEGTRAQHQLSSQTGASNWTLSAFIIATKASSLPASGGICLMASIRYQLLCASWQGGRVCSAFHPRRWRGQAIDASPLAVSELYQQTTGSAARTKLSSATPNAQNTAAARAVTATLTTGGSACH